MVGTRLFAHVTTNALLVVNKHFTVRALIDRLHRAYLHAGRVIAVHAGDAEIVDNASFFVFNALNVVPLNVGGNLVFFLADRKAGVATHATVGNND